jgi:hypothetical protein
MAKIAVFFAGLFFGGAIDHMILAAAGRTTTPYGIEVGVVGNVALAGLDFLLTLGSWFAHRWLERPKVIG